MSKRMMNLINKNKVNSDHKRSGTGRSPMDASPDITKYSKHISVEDTEDPVFEMDEREENVE